MLVGTKIDLREDPDTLNKLAEKHLRPISTGEGVLLAQEIGALAYKECSALTQEGLQETMKCAMRAGVVHTEGSYEYYRMGTENKKRKKKSDSYRCSVM